MFLQKIVSEEKSKKGSRLTSAAKFQSKPKSKKYSGKNQFVENLRKFSAKGNSHIKVNNRYFITDFVEPRLEWQNLNYVDDNICRKSHLSSEIGKKNSFLESTNYGFLNGRTSLNCFGINTSQGSEPGVLENSFKNLY